MSLPRIASVTALFAISLSLLGCAKASKEECEKMVDKMTELEIQGQDPTVADLTRKFMKETQKDLVADCEGKVTKSQIQCVADAKTKADLDNCR